ncbi:hypothetical protein [Streptomyces sp. NPDC002599]|uniref:hypothetical protein n=1 Tax=Streptomyces sp. NPDC002599 TaxID=3154421 RepID=UPI0033209163
MKRRERHEWEGGLPGIGFASHPDSGHNLVMVVSYEGRGLFVSAAPEEVGPIPSQLENGL